MKQRFLVLLLGIGLIGVLVILNALTYVQKQTETDSEFNPNRSTYNSAATGTQGLYTLLLETGRNPVRWQDSPEGLTTARKRPDVFVMTGTFRRPVTEEDSSAVLRWVSQGGRLVLIDRNPPKELCTSTANWKIEVSSDPAAQLLSVDPSDQNAMTSNMPAAKPVQPSIFTAQINAVQPSMFAGWVSFERYSEEVYRGYRNSAPPPASTRLFQQNGPYTLPAPTPDELETNETEETYEPDESGPVVHIAGREKNLLVDVPYGAGRIVYLTDPYIVSNGGISIVDNAQLALNIVATPGGTIAFDEYHQGYGTNANRLFQYFEGTPVIAIFIQCSLLIALVFISQSRRFARALPGQEPDRLSKLEYVSAMAELQQRTRAYDLAIENIYAEFRRRVTRVLGLDNINSKRRDIAEAIAERTSMDAFEVYQTMSKCEAIIQGEPTKSGETVELAAQLRDIEEKLGIKRTPRGRTGR
jgi:hypothetical protein